jgi:head-tail adaptor
VRAGALDRQITIERKAVAGDPEFVTNDAKFGTQKVAWAPLDRDPSNPSAAVKSWAEVQESLPSRAEGIALGAVIARNQARIRMRYRDDIDSSMRITVHGDDADTVYQIIGGPAQVTAEGRKTMIEVFCERYSS